MYRLAILMVVVLLAAVEHISFNNKLAVLAGTPVTRSPREHHYFD